MSKEKKLEEIFSLKDNKLYTFKNFIFSIIILNEGNYAIILYKELDKNKISKIYFKEKDIFLYETINVDIDNYVLYPSYNKLMFAYSNNNEIFIINISNLNTIKKFVINNKFVKIKFMEWQGKRKGLISCVTNENIVYFFDQNTKIFDINNKNEEIFSIKYFNYKETDERRVNYYIILGVYNNIKLYKLRENKIYNKNFSYENIEYENINIIEILYDKNNEIYILIGNKENFKFNIYEYKKGNFNLLYVLENFIKFFKNLDDTIISLNYIDKEGIIVCMKKKIYFFYLNNDELFLDFVLDSEEEIKNFKVIKSKNQYENNSIFYTTGSNIKSIKFDFNNNNLDINNLNNNTYKQFEREKNDFLFEMKNKSYNIYIDKYENSDIYLLVIFDIKFTIDFTSKNKISILKCSDTKLMEILNDEVEKFNNKDISNKNIIKTFNDLYEIIIKIKKINLSEKKTIVPYFKNNNFTFTKTGEIVKYSYHKIDFNLLNENNKEIKNYSNLNSWVKFCLDNNSHLNFVFNENKLIPEDEKIIVLQTLRELSNFNFSKGKDISEYFNFINTNKKLFEDKTNNKLNSNEENSQNTKKRFHLISFDDEEKFSILKNLNINLLNDKQFYKTLINSLNSLNNNDDDDIIILIDILNYIDHDINGIIENDGLMLYHIESIYNKMQIFEMNKSFEILFICVFFLASRIFEKFLENNDNIEKEKRKTLSSNNLLNNDYKNKNFNSEEIFFNKIDNYNNNILESDDNLFLDIKENNSEKTNNSELFISNINYSSNNSFKSYENNNNNIKDKKESQNLNKSNINQSHSFPNFNIKQEKSKYLIDYFDKNFINILIQYLIFISEEFIKMGRTNESKEIKEYVNLINQ